MIEPEDLKRDTWPEDAIWRQRMGETRAQYNAFTIFLSMPAELRTVKNAHNQFIGPDIRKEGSKSHESDGHGVSRTWKAWAVDFDWYERAHAYQLWKRREEILFDEEERARDAAVMAGIRQRHRDQALSLGQAMIDKARAMLQFPLAEVERTVTVYEDGKAREVQVFKPGRWNFTTVARLVDSADKLIRLAADMDTQRTTVNFMLLHEEAERLAAENGLDREDVLAMADKIVKERWPQYSPERDD